jgi:hypothetical protein
MACGIGTGLVPRYRSFDASGRFVPPDAVEAASLAARAVVAGQLGAAAQSQRGEIGQRQSADCPKHVAEGVAPGIAVGLGVRRRPDTHPVQHDDGRAPHQGFGMLCTN